MIENVRDFGQMIDEAALKKGLKELNPNLLFDCAVNLGYTHPFESTRQGVFLDTRHVCSMDRGMLPEYNVWALVTMPDGSKRKNHIHRVGWRHTMQAMITKRVPGITWDALEAKFGIRPKRLAFGQDPALVEVA